MSTARLKQVNFDTHIKPKSISIPDTKTGDNGTAMLPKKVRISKIPAKRFLYRSLWAQIFEKKFQTFEKKTEKKRSWVDLGPRSAWEKLSRMLFRSGNTPSPRQTSIQKTTTAPWNRNGARSLGAPTHPPVSVHKAIGDTSRAPARRWIQAHLGAAV